MPPLRAGLRWGSLLVGLSLVSACASQARPTPGTRQLTDKDTGSAVVLSVGDRLEITLASNPTTGYQWELAAGDAAILRPSSEPQYVSEGSAPGSGGRVTLPFEAVGAGQTGLKLIYHRPFETNVAPLRTFVVSVTVK